MARNRLFGSSFHSAWGSGFKVKHPTAASTSKKKGVLDHSLIGNFLGDVRDAAVGLPMGLLTMGKAEYHDIGDALNKHDYSFGRTRAIGTAMGKGMAYDWSPLIHGDYKEWYKRFHSHPLAPILDAVSVATLPFAGVGAGIKGADTLIAVGTRGAEAAGAARTASALLKVGNKTERAASFFRPKTRTLDAIPGQPEAFKHYAGNPMTRLGQVMGEKVMNKTGLRSDVKRQRARLDRMISERGAARDTMFKRELIATRKLIKQKTMSADDIANTLDPHIYSIAEHHAMKVKAGPKGGIPKLGEEWAFLPDRGAWARKKIAYPSDIAKKRGLDEKDPRVFQEWMKNYGARLMTRDARKAATSGNHYLVVHSPTLHAMVKEGTNTYTALHALYYTPTKVWKWMILATAPRYFINNVVGNGLMVTASMNPVAMGRAMHDMIATAHGTAAARRSMNEVNRAVDKMVGDWVDKNYSAVHLGFSSDIMKYEKDWKGRGVPPYSLARHEKINNPVLRGIASVGVHGLYGITHFASDTIFRKLLVNRVIRKNPEYIRLRRSGLSHEQAGEMASKDPAVRDWVERQVSDTLGQYHHFNKTEKAIKTFVPFYGWDRAIMRHTAAMVRERPLEADIGSRLGQQGSAETNKILGKIPRFLEGSIPLSVLGMDKGGKRKSVLTTTGLNPYATVPDVLEAGASLAHGDPRIGEVLGGQINPIITGSIEEATGQSLLSGAKIKRGGSVSLMGAKIPFSGLYPDVLARTAESTPYVQLFKSLRDGTPQPGINKRTGKASSPFLYKKDSAQYIDSLFGVPIKQVSPEKAGELYSREHGLTTSKGHVSLLGFKGNRTFGGRKTRSYTYRVRKPSVRRISAVTFKQPKNVLPKINF